MVQGQGTTGIIDLEHQRHLGGHLASRTWCSQGEEVPAELWAESEQNVCNFCLTSGDKFHVVSCDAGSTPWWSVCRLCDMLPGNKVIVYLSEMCTKD